MKKTVILCSLALAAVAFILAVGLFDDVENRSGEVLPLATNQQKAKGPVGLTRDNIENTSSNNTGSLGGIDDSISSDEGISEKPAHEDFTARYDMQVDMYDEENAPEIDMSADYDSYRVDMPVDDETIIDMTPSPDELSRDQ